MDSYREFVLRYLDLMGEAEKIPLGTYSAPAWPRPATHAPKALLLSAHPDDEILTAMPLGLRFVKEGWDVVNVAVTLGRPDQRDRRRKELDAACAYLGIRTIVPDDIGLRERIKSGDADEWQECVAMMAKIIDQAQPEVIIVHHSDDGHPDHMRTNQLAQEAMAKCAGLKCLFIEGEYWKDMASPNLQLEIPVNDLVVLLEALSFHVGELERNRYDVFWPPFAHVNARYSETVTGWGSASAKFDFSVMYRVRRYRGVGLEDFFSPLQLGADQSVHLIFP
jgi:LmbE family N-acetylglucosaminyl deacetylase